MIKPVALVVGKKMRKGEGGKEVTERVFVNGGRHSLLWPQETTFEKSENHGFCLNY